MSCVRLRVTRAAAEPIIRRLAVFHVTGASAGSLAPGRPAQSDLPAGARGWQRCGAWTAQDFRDRRATLTLDLSPFTLRPGQFEVKFEQTGGKHVFRFAGATLLYEGAEATPGLLTRLAAPNTFNVNRTAQVTGETTSVLKVDLTAEGGRDCEGLVQSRPRPTQ
ncbi:MAG: hypothetical protein H7A47_09470 [Verrucomicrobiales bacterium]|nr:hypothetical protein [Verrucomicrobiales bacterium]